jgi:hypothetical protein
MEKQKKKMTTMEELFESKNMEIEMTKKELQDAKAQSAGRQKQD